MNKAFRTAILGAIMCILASLIAGCSVSDKFEGKWVTDVKEGGTFAPRAAVLDIQKNGDKDYFVEFYYVTMNGETGELREDKFPHNRVAAQQKDTGNTLVIPQGMGFTISYNENTKCLESNLVPYFNEYKKLKNGEYDQEFKNKLKELFDPWYQKQKEWDEWLKQESKKPWKNY